MRTGRPKSKNPKYSRVTIRFSEREHKALQAAAKEMGFQDNLSEFVRLVLFTAAAIVYKEKAHEANS